MLEALCSLLRHEPARTTARLANSPLYLERIVTGQVPPTLAFLANCYVRLPELRPAAMAAVAQHLEERAREYDAAHASEKEPAARV